MDNEEYFFLLFSTSHQQEKVAADTTKPDVFPKFSDDVIHILFALLKVSAYHILEIIRPLQTESSTRMNA